MIKTCPETHEDILVRIATMDGVIADAEAYKAKLENCAANNWRGVFFGWAAYGIFFREGEANAVGPLQATIYGVGRERPAFAVRNGKGEFAKPVAIADALAFAIAGVEKNLAFVRDCRAKAEAKLEELDALERNGIKIVYDVNVYAFQIDGELYWADTLEEARAIIDAH